MTDKHALILLGHNGAGKSTLIRYLLGFYPDERGHPFLPHWQHLPSYTDKTIGYVPELPFLDPHLTGWDTLKLQAKLNHTPLSKQQAGDAVNAVGLDSDVLTHRIQTYSKGMRQRLMLAQACYHKPDVLVLDEPLSGLDPFGHQAILDLLQTMKQHSQLLLSTHSLEDAYRLGDEIWLLQAGTLVYQGDKPGSIEALNDLYFKYPPHAIGH